MSRAGWMMWMVVACLAVPGMARAQDQETLQPGAGASGMLNLPLVVKENGWARYSIATEEGGTAELVFRVGPAGRHQGRPGQWIYLEVPMPEVGLITIEFLVAGGRFSGANVMRMRVRMPGEPARDAEMTAKPPTLPVPKAGAKKREQVVGQSLEVTQFTYPDKSSAYWSGAVPALGLIRADGAQSLRLVAFGVGGDPWKGLQTAPMWPDKEQKLKP